MSDTEFKARAGDLIVFSTGEYSDFGYQGHFVALEDINPQHFADAKIVAETKYRECEEARDAWRKDDGGAYPGWVSKHEAFIAALIRAGLLLSVTVTEHHIGSYGDLDID